MKLKSGLILTLFAIITVVVAGCGSEPADASRATRENIPGVEIEPRSVLGPALTNRWGEIVRWRIGGADWTIELPEDGWWDFVNPAEGSGQQPASATYRTTSTHPNIFVDVVRLELANLTAPTCERPTVMSVDGTLISEPIEDLFLDGHQTMVTRVTAPASDGSTTGSYELCFVTDSAMYQIVSGTRPGSAVPDMFSMLNSFRLES